MELDYDGDTSDSRQYCQHGTFIGSWWGPDYMCGWCEDGVSVADMHAALAAQAARRTAKAWSDGQGIVDAVAAAVPYTSKVATELVAALTVFGEQAGLR